jgi:protein involved in polysaccharide export with SLBB domain
MNKSRSTVNSPAVTTAAHLLIGPLPATATSWAFIVRGWLLLVLLSSFGCASARVRPVPSYAPAELTRIPQPTYEVAAPDRLFIDVTIRAKPAPVEYGIQPDDVLSIELRTGPATAQNSKPVFTGQFVLVAPDGKIRVAEYGDLKVGGLNLDEISQQLQTLLKEHKDIQAADPRVSVQLVAVHEPLLLLTGERLVRPDGTVNLSPYGDLYLQGMKLEEIKDRVRQQILLQRPDLVPRLKASDEMYIDVEVTGFNSQVCYIQYEVGAPTLFPITGNETVLDAIVRAGSATEFADRNDVYLVRVSPFEGEGPEILPVCLRDIIECGRPETNYQLRPGDRIVVPPRHIVAFNRCIAPFLQAGDAVATTALLYQQLVYNFIRGPNPVALSKTVK